VLNAFPPTDFDCRSLVEWLFEPGSKLTRIDNSALGGCRSLRLMSIPSQLEVLEGGRFIYCHSLSQWMFEVASKSAF
jgi:hypothetical protein